MFVEIAPYHLDIIQRKQNIGCIGFLYPNEAVLYSLWFLRSFAIILINTIMISSWVYSIHYDAYSDGNTVSLLAKSAFSFLTTKTDENIFYFAEIFLLIISVNNFALFLFMWVPLLIRNYWRKHFALLRQSGGSMDVSLRKLLRKDPKDLSLREKIRILVHEFHQKEGHSDQTHIVFSYYFKSIQVLLEHELIKYFLIYIICVFVGFFITKMVYALLIFDITVTPLQSKGE